MQPMKIIRMTAEHTAKLAELEKLCFSEPWSEKAFLEETDNPAAFFVVAVEGDEILGYGGMHTVLGESYIDNIAVFPQYRGRGAGRHNPECQNGLVSRGGGYPPHGPRRFLPQKQALRPRPTGTADGQVRPCQGRSRNKIRQRSHPSAPKLLR